MSKPIEYKTYSCKCGYHADVLGGKQEEYYGTIETHVCLSCKILIECETQEAVADFNLMGYNYKKATPICMMCGEPNVILWDSKLCKCPKCEKEMEVTRLELNIEDVGTIKII